MRGGHILLLLCYNGSMSREEKIKEIAKKTSPIFAKYGIKYAGLFGSYARGEDRPDSDIDILVTLGDQTFTLLDLARFKDEIRSNLKKEVDRVYEFAERARALGLDPVDKVEIPIAMTMAEKVVGLISVIYPQVLNTNV